MKEGIAFMYLTMSQQLVKLVASKWGPNAIIFSSESLEPHFTVLWILKGCSISVIYVVISKDLQGFSHRFEKSINIDIQGRHECLQSVPVRLSPRTRTFIGTTRRHLCRSICVASSMTLALYLSIKMGN